MCKKSIIKALKKWTANLLWIRGKTKWKLTHFPIPTTNLFIKFSPQYHIFAHKPSQVKKHKLFSLFSSYEPTPLYIYICQ